MSFSEDHDDYITGERFPYSMKDYRCEYTYNEKKDWISAVLTPNFLDRYLVIREIFYFK